MGLKCLHIFAVNGGENCGDFFLGVSTRHYFKDMIKDQIVWTLHDVRKPVTPSDVAYFNTFDHIVIGGGGLILPDTNPNNISCWQWAISTDLIKKISKPIHVIGLGYNLFFGQTISHPNRNDNKENTNRVEIFKNNMNTLIDKSTTMLMRHKGDITELEKVIGNNQKIKFDFCPVYYYVKKLQLPVLTPTYHTFEIKQDREWRRYHGTSKKKVYDSLTEFARELIKKGESIAVMKHEHGQSNFEKHLRTNNVPFILLDNTVKKEQAILENFSKVKKLYCTAGHSQIIAEAMGIPYFSLIGHPKLKYFLEDIKSNKGYAYTYDDGLLEKLFSTIFK